MEEVYRTKDIWLAVYLQIKGHSFAGVEPEGDKKFSNRFMFVFENDEGIRADEMAYLNHKALVDITTISGTLKMLKTHTRSVATNSNEEVTAMGKAFKNAQKKGEEK